MDYKKWALLSMLLFLSLLFFNSIANAQEELTISVAGGSFVVKNISLPSEGDSLCLKSDLVNKTDRDWNEVSFEFDVYYTVNGELKEYKGAFIIHDIKRGETKSICPFYYFMEKNAVFSRYEIRFKSGEFPVNYIFSMIKPKENKDLGFEDNFLGILFSISETQIAFVLYNKTSNPIKVDWNQISYIDIFGKTHKVMHSEVKYVDKEKPQAPTIVPPTARLEDLVFPIDYIYYTSGKYGGWNKYPLFPKGSRSETFKGKSLSVFMPLEIDGTIKNYLFSFKIDVKY